MRKYLLFGIFYIKSKNDKAEPVVKTIKEKAEDDFDKKYDELKAKSKHGNCQYS